MRAAFRIAATAVGACLCLGLACTPARAESSQAVAPSPQLTQPRLETKPPPGHELSAREAVAIADHDPKVADQLVEHHPHTFRAYTKGTNVWQVSYFDTHSKEFAQVIINDRARKVIDVWTGSQVAWSMARGIPGAFGRKVNATYVWVPLMAIFFVAFFDWRRPGRLLHLDLLMLLSFSVSQVFFNRGEIVTSVPLAYIPLVYMLVRMLAGVFVPALRRRHRPARPIVPAAYLAIALIFLVGFRIGLNVTNSNVIDVGYSGVIGADRITHGKSPYGSFPRDDQSGDTYGPVAYYAYVPAELAFPWRGRWDDLRAAHAVAIAFDLATIVGLLLVGRRLRRGRKGTELGVALAFAWASFPYTLLVMNSNANDSLVAALLVFCFLALSSSRGRGVLLALASATKFAPLALAPLFASYDQRRLRDALPFGLAFVVAAVAVTVPLIGDGGPSELWNRTVGFQLGRGSPFSIWGQHPGLGWLQDAVKVGAAALALAVAFWPARKSALDVAALGAAVLIALQLTFTHWFYLYVVWWLPFALIALLAPAAVASARAALPDQLGASRSEPAPSPAR